MSDSCVRIAAGSDATRSHSASRQMSARSCSASVPKSRVSSVTTVPAASMTQARAPLVPKSMPRKNKLAARVRLVFELHQVDARRGLPAFLAVLGDDVGEDAAAHVELGRQTHVARLGRRDEVVEDAVGDVLVEVTLVAEAPHVELQA